MLKGIPEIISPELLKILSEMGHGSEIVICDANCPALELVKNCLRSDVKKHPSLWRQYLHLCPLIHTKNL